MSIRAFGNVSHSCFGSSHSKSPLRSARQFTKSNLCQQGCPCCVTYTMTCASFRIGTSTMSREPQSWATSFSGPSNSGVRGTARHLPFQARIASDAASSSDDAGSSYEELQEKLDQAVRSENYAAAAILRDRLRDMHEGCLSDILAANALFYRAFQQADMRLMDRIWADGDHVQCLHPGSLCISGRDEILQSWRYVLGSSADYKVELEDVRVHCNGTLGFVTCVENHQRVAGAGRVAATNVFELQGGQWLICLHQGGPLLPTSSNVGM